MSEDEGYVVINDRLRIPLGEISFRFSPSSGPGGQHANRSATRVTLIFDAAASPSLQALLSATAREHLLNRLAPRLDGNGVLQLSVQDSRSQYQNRETAVARFRSLLAAGLHQPRKRRKTKPSRSAQEKRIASKKRRSQRKKSRRWRYSGE